MSGFVHLTHRYLVGAPVVFAFLAVNFCRAGPSLWCPQNNHGPDRPLRDSLVSGIIPNLSNFGRRFIQYGSQPLMHQLGFMSFDKVWLVSVALK